MLPKGPVEAVNPRGQTIQWPKEKEQTMIYKILHIKLKIELHEPH
jgi:hypothetical protein